MLEALASNIGPIIPGMEALASIPSSPVLDEAKLHPTLVYTRNYGQSKALPIISSTMKLGFSPISVQFLWALAQILWALAQILWALAQI